MTPAEQKKIRHARRVWHREINALARKVGKMPAKFSDGLRGWVKVSK